MDREASEKHLRKIPRIIDYHEIAGPELGLTESKMTAVNQIGTPELQRVDMLRKWKQKFSWRSTYHILTEGLLSCSRAD